MRTRLLLAPALVLTTVTSPALGEESEKLEDPTAKASYSLGYQMGQDLKMQGVTLDRPTVLSGLKDGQAETEPKMDPEQMRTLLGELKRELEAKAQQRHQEQIAARMQPGIDFLEANKSKPGVQTTESGLQYKVIQEGTGKRPKPTDTVRVQYRGRTVAGREFDSSHKRGKPAEFAVNRVIRGWGEGLQLMREGAKYEIYIPMELAYGRRGPLSYQALIFEVELLAVNPPSSEPAEATAESE